MKLTETRKILKKEGLLSEGLDDMQLFFKDPYGKVELSGLTALEFHDYMLNMIDDIDRFAETIDADIYIRKDDKKSYYSCEIKVGVAGKFLPLLKYTYNNDKDEIINFELYGLSIFDGEIKYGKNGLGNECISINKVISFSPYDNTIKDFETIERILKYNMTLLGKYRVM